MWMKGGRMDTVGCGWGRRWAWRVKSEAMWNERERERESVRERERKGQKRMSNETVGQNV